MVAHRNLKPARLPISPRPQKHLNYKIFIFNCQAKNIDGRLILK